MHAQLVDMASDSVAPGERRELPVLAARDVLFPGNLQPVPLVDAGAMLRAQVGDGLVLVLATRTPDRHAATAPTLDELHSVGCIGRVLKLMKAEADGQALAVVRGLARGRVIEALPADHTSASLRVRAEVLADRPPLDPEEPQFVALVRTVRDLCATVIGASPVLPSELVAVLESLDDPSAIADFAARILPSVALRDRQRLLETLDVRSRVEAVFESLVREHESMKLRRQMVAAAEAKIGRVQREVMLREQLEAIRNELGETDPAARSAHELRVKIGAAGMNDTAEMEAYRELDRLQQVPTESAEHGVISTHLEWLVSLPWNAPAAAPIDVAHARRVLDEDHCRLEKAKSRIVEYLAVLRLRRAMHGPILCFVGPPGVGKTSVGRSIARASGRAFVRVSLGGTRDEADIRGHRRTYVGAFPGRIIEGIRRAHALDPVFMLDEIDKLGRDVLGDPAAALMEVLDPEQNSAFVDHYLDVPFDLSKVLFIATANVLDAVPAALRDRMEVIELPGYSESEKLEIARRHLVPREIAENGLVEDQIAFRDDALVAIVRGYTSEAGVRALERNIASICRRHATAVAEDAAIAGSAIAPLLVTPQVVRATLGVPHDHDERVVERACAAGVSVALAWTPHGGEVLFVEAARMPRDRGEVQLTGQLGDVMQESARTAFSWVRANADRFGISAELLRGSDLHVHVPGGGVPKDGPSAGLAIVAAIVSCLTGRTPRTQLAFAGEISLAGFVLPVGGIEHKLLAADRAGVREVVLPRRNEANVLEEVPRELRERLKLTYVDTIAQALQTAFDAPVATRTRQFAAPR